MRFSHRSLVSTVPCSFASLGAALLAVFAPAGAVVAQLQPQAAYPLISDLLDTTNTYGPVMLTGAPPPSLPANGICVNGIYFYSPGGQDVRTPLIGSMDPNDFQIDFEFQLAALPAVQAPILMGGHSYRWLGLYVQANGTLGLKHNNNNYTWSTTTVTTGRWYLASVRFEQGTVEIHLNGHMVHTAVVGVLNTNNGANLNFTTNDFSNGGSHNGCIRNLVISNNTTLGVVASTMDYGYGCDGLAMTSSGLPSLGNATFALSVSNVPVVSPIVMVALGVSLVNPGLDLGQVGMPGCASFTGIEGGLLGPAVAVSGTAVLPVPIPNLPSITGLVLYTQALSLSSANALGLATSNGTQLVVGL